MLRMVVDSSEGLPTLLALKGFLTCVDSLMLTEVGTAKRGLPTDFTFTERIITGDSLVLQKFMAKSLPTIVTPTVALSPV